MCWPMPAGQGCCWRWHRRCQLRTLRCCAAASPPAVPLQDARAADKVRSPYGCPCQACCQQTLPTPTDPHSPRTNSNKGGRRRRRRGCRSRTAVLRPVPCCAPGCPRAWAPVLRAAATRAAGLLPRLPGAQGSRCGAKRRRRQAGRQDARLAKPGQARPHQETGGRSRKRTRPRTCSSCSCCAPAFSLRSCFIAALRVSAAAALRCAAVYCEGELRPPAANSLTYLPAERRDRRPRKGRSQCAGAPPVSHFAQLPLCATLRCGEFSAGRQRCLPGAPLTRPPPWTSLPLAFCILRADAQVSVLRAWHGKRGERACP